MLRDCLVFSVCSGHDVVDVVVVSQYGGTSRKSCVFVVGELTKCTDSEKWRARQTVCHRVQSILANRIAERVTPENALIICPRESQEFGGTFFNVRHDRVLQPSD